MIGTYSIVIRQTSICQSDSITDSLILVRLLVPNYFFGGSHHLFDLRILIKISLNLFCAFVQNSFLIFANSIINDDYVLIKVKC